MGKMVGFEPTKVSPRFERWESNPPLASSPPAAFAYSATFSFGPEGLSRYHSYAFSSTIFIKYVYLIILYATYTWWSEWGESNPRLLLGRQQYQPLYDTRTIGEGVQNTRELSTPMICIYLTSWQDEADSNRHYTDFKSAVSAVGLPSHKTRHKFFLKDSNPLKKLFQKFFVNQLNK